MTIYQKVRFIPSNMIPPMNASASIGTVRLQAGADTSIELSVFDRIKHTQPYQEMKKWGAIVEKEQYETNPKKSEVKKEDEPFFDDDGNLMNLSTLNVTDAKKEITDQDNVDVLERWLEVEQSSSKPRSSVTSALEMMIQQLKNKE